jgi:hypothetical protein
VQIGYAFSAISKTHDVRFTSATVLFNAQLTALEKYFLPISDVVNLKDIKRRNIHGRLKERINLIHSKYIKT